MSKSSTTTGGISFLGALFLVFLTLKLTNHIDWSWWWVTCPLWCGPALIIGFAILCAIVILIDTILKLFFKRK